MKKIDLIAMLDHVGDDEEIVFMVPTGNYWRQVKAAPINDIRTGVVAYSEYLQADQLLTPEDQQKAVRLDEKGEEVPDNEPFDPKHKSYYDNQPIRPVRVLF